MSLPLTGKVALVTGSSRGIGAAIAHRLVDDGANVVVNYVNNGKAAQDVVDALNAKRTNAAISVKADVSDSAQAKSLLNQTVNSFSKIDIIVLNAGIMHTKTLAEIDEAHFDQHFNTNVKGPLFLVKSAAPLLSAGSRIILFSTSLTLASTVTPNYLVYAATKGAIEQITRVLAKDLGAQGITVNCISPGPIDTDLFRDGKSPQQIAFIENVHPQKRLGQVEEVASAVAFLANPEASWVNGQNLRVNGGFAV